MPSRAVLSRITSFLAALLLALALVAPVFIAARVALRGLERGISADNRVQRVTSARVGASLAGTSVGATGGQVEGFTARQGLAVALRDRADAVLGRLMADMHRTNPRFFSTLALDADGVLLARDPPLPGLAGQSFADRDWYRGALVSDGWFASTAYSGQPAVQALVVFSAAVRQDGAPVGVIAAVLDTATFLAGFEPLAAQTGRELLLVDGRGQVIAGSDPDRPALSAVHTDGFAPAYAGTSGEAEAALVDGGGTRVLSFAPVPATGWALVMADRPATILAGERRLRNEITLIVTLGALAVAVAVASVVDLYRVRGRREARAGAERERLLQGERSARREAERALLVRDQVVSTVTHDLKNPLATIRGHAQMLRRRLARTGTADPASVETGLEQIEVASGRMAAMMDELLDTARLQQGEPLALRRAAVDLEEVVRGCVTSQHGATERHRVTLDDQAGEALVGEWDRARIERVIDNLLSNAIKYSPAGGTVRVCLGRVDGGGSCYAVLSVTDEGIGVPAADLPHIFDRWRRAGNVGDIAGTGVGLAGAKQIVEQHGGTITAESTEGRGTTLTVRLPLAPAPEPVPA